MDVLSAGERGPTDWSDWKKHRSQVVHPAGCIKAEDIARARRNVERHDWARRFVESRRKAADRFLEQLTPQFLETMLEVTSPGCAGACPACMAKGLAWHPTGQWAWSPKEPEQLTCKVCKTVFPHPDYPETIAIRSKFDPRQVITYCDGPTYKCHGYKQARPSPSSIVRAKKLGYMTSQLVTLARVYAVTGDAKYARGARAILLRLAEVFPKYLVTAGYGYLEYADCDPHVAAERIMDLPTDEICPPPNKPDRKLHTGYWSASRNGSWGHEGGWERRVAGAYDLTCEAKDDGKPVFTDGERIRIERDVLLEGTYLCVCEPRLTNKSIRGRCAAAEVGLVVGHPGLVHWGVKEFCGAVDGGWFLPDGGACECSSYAIVVMTAVDSYMTMFRDYSDPKGYAAADGSRLDHWNACRDTRFGDCWQALLWTLQGDLKFPPMADTFKRANIPLGPAELLAACYPRAEYQALLKARLGGKWRGAGWQSLFYRDPELEKRELPAVRLPDVVFPFLGQGYLRTGPEGRRGTLVLNASDWGGHHHSDSLNLYFWQDGRELLSDLGYLWDNPDKKNLYRTFAHNLVMIDGAEQQRRGRGGRFHLFATGPGVKAMEASSRAYPEAGEYRRTCVQVEHGAGRVYVVDIFRVAGGQTVGYVFHGPNTNMSVEGITPTPVAAPAKPVDAHGVATLQNTKRADGASSWRAVWEFEDGYRFKAWSAGGEGETVILGDGWGQRDAHNKDRGAVLPYLVRRVAGREKTVFVSVFEGCAKGQDWVRAVRCIPVTGDASRSPVAVAVETPDGVDVILSQTEPGPASVNALSGRVQTDARLAVLLARGGGFNEALLVGGHSLHAGDLALTDCPGICSGRILGTHSAGGDSWFVVDAPLPSKDALSGTALFAVDNDGVRRAYPIRDVRTENGEIRLYTKASHVGFEAVCAATWEIPLVIHLRVARGDGQE